MESPENVEILFEMAAKTLSHWEESTSGERMTIFERADEEISRYMQAVDETQSWIEAKTESEDQSRGRCMMEQLMAGLQHEFESVLGSQIPRIRAWNGEHFDGIFGSQSHSFMGSTTYSSSVSEGTSFGFDEELDYYGALLSEQRICYLRTIAEKMNSTGFLHQCVDAYARVSKSHLDLQFRWFDFRKLGTRDVKKMNWDMLEKEMTGWIRVAKVCFRILFEHQKRLCDQIFAGIGTLSHHAYFRLAVEEHASQLLEVVAALSTCRGSTERLFKILDLHEALSGLLQYVEDLFGSNSFLDEAVETLGRLSETVRGILSDLPETVLHEPSVALVAGGSIHPLVRYVMNYLVLTSDYEETLNALIASKPSFSDYPYIGGTESLKHHGGTPFALNLIWIIVVLQFNLERKSKHYEDASLSHLFMMNNLNYIVEKIKHSPELGELLGDVYLKELSAKVGQAAISYQRSSWGGVLDCLRDEGVQMSGPISSGVSKSVLRERLKSFNALFDKAHRTQATWLITDTELRDDLRISISLKLIPAYRSFLRRFGSDIERGRKPGTYIKHTAEELEAAVFDLFEGLPISQR